MKQDLTVDMLKGGISVRKMHTYISEVQGSEQCIADGVQQYIRITMAKGSFFEWNLNSSQYQFPAFHQTMKIDAKTDSEWHTDYLKRKSAVIRIPLEQSASKLSVLKKPEMIYLFAALEIKDQTEANRIG